jgi:hypothetical protein
MGKSRGFRANGKLSEQSNSFALFSDDDTVSMVSRPDNTSCEVVKEDKERTEDKQDRSQAADEKSDKPQHSDKEVGRHSTRGFRSIKNNKVDHVPESPTSTDKGETDTEHDGKNRITGKKEQGVPGHGKGSISQKRGNKRKVQKVEGGDPVQQGEPSIGEVVDYSKYKIREFESTDRPQVYSITGKPKKTKDQSIVEVIIEGCRYKVSPWSIKGSQYYQ